MANYYVSNTGDNTNDGLSPATPWLDLGYAILNASGSATIRHNIFIMDNVQLTSSFLGAARSGISIFSYDGTLKEVNILQDLSSARTLALRRIVENIKFIAEAGSVTSSNNLTFDAGGAFYNCEWEISPITNSNVRYIMRMTGSFLNNKFKSENQGVFLFGGSTGAVTASGGFSNCIFDTAKFNLAATPGSALFKNCIIRNCEWFSSGSYIFNSLCAVILDNCSIQLTFNQSIFSMEGIGEIIGKVQNSVIEAPMGSSSYIVEATNDFEEYVIAENCVLYNVIPINPIFSILTQNITTTLETNWKSIDPLEADFMQLTNTSPARGYATYANIDAGALQADPLILFPATGKVVAGVPFGNGENGDRVGEYETAPENKVELNFEYGDPTAPFTGTLPAPDIVDGNTVLEGITINGTPGKYKPADVLKYESGETFGEENGTVRVGEAVLLPNQPGRVPLYIYTSDESPINGSFGPSQTFYLIDNTSVDAFLEALGVAERLSGGTAIVETDLQNGLLKQLRLVR